MKAVIIAAVLVATGMAGIACAEDLLALYRQAAESSPALAQAQALLQAEQAGQTVARAALAPKLQAGAAVSRNRLDLEGFGPAIDDEEYTASSYSVTLTQPLFKAGDWAALRAARAQARSSESGLQAAQKALILQVACAYFEVLRAEAVERTASSRQALLQKIADQAQGALRVGTGDRIAVEETRAALDGAQADLLAARNAVRMARCEIERLTHCRVGELVPLEDLEPQGPVPARVEEWVAVAEANQPLLEQARLQLQASRHLASAAERAGWPAVSLNLEYDHADGAFTPSANRREGFAGVRAVWPIFQGGEIRAAHLKAEAVARARQYGLQALEDEVRLNVQRAFLDLEDSVAQLTAMRRALASAATALKATQQGYEIGARPVVDVLDSARQHADAQAGFYGALYHQVLARLQLKAAAGILSEKDVESVNALLAAGSIPTPATTPVPGGMHL